MKRLLMTTILATLALAGTPYAQEPPAMPAITLPDGFGLQEGPLTVDVLTGATIYDSTGESIGAVADLVFDMPASGMSMDGAVHTGQAATDGTNHEGMNVDALDGAQAEGLDGEAGEQVVPGTNDAVNGVGGGTATNPGTNAAHADTDAAADDNTAAGRQDGQTATAQDANPDNPQVHGGTADQANTDVDGSDTDGDGVIDNAPDGTTAGADASGLDATTHVDSTEAADQEDTATNADEFADSEADLNGAATGTDAPAAGQTAPDATAAQVEEMVEAHEGVVGMDGTADGGMTSTGANGVANTAPTDTGAQGGAEDMPATSDAADPHTTEASDADMGATADASATTAQDAGVAGGSAAASQITHAILDIGGFLGLGQHRVAIPISDLAVYANGDEIRVYLPWTRAQLEALPAYDAEDPASLGTSPWQSAN